MARKTAMGDLLGWGFGFLIVYLGYEQARKCRFGTDLYQLAAGINNSLSSIKMDTKATCPVSGAQQAAGTGAGAGAGAGRGGGGCGFAAGWRYVTLVSGTGTVFDGYYQVVWKGQHYGYYRVQSDAEAAYNALVAAQGCV